MNEIIKKNGITFGIIGGLISIAITLYAYLIDLTIFGSLWLLLFIVILYIVINIILLSKTKKELNNSFSFKEAFTTFFISMVISVVMSVLFNIILFNLIDLELAEKVKQVAMESTSSLMKKFGAPTSEIIKAVKEIEESDNYSIGKQIQGLFMNIVVSSIFGLIFAAIFKSKPKEQF
ncbi:DUF4199 domain-containing protein [uncultured Flavobacterium sp.]|mgnify:FL=1|uniref:DUF4199 domain-containing protein n=1 Tax=uncultured Flavobacterium sp. TaxID=165435 RepID=UPI0030EC6E7B|tara:strand:- start:59635 stop:60165 length:531 start_codon:yes stop_codon:yes gene_type:complete